MNYPSLNTSFSVLQIKKDFSSGYESPSFQAKTTKRMRKMTAHMRAMQTKHMKRHLGKALHAHNTSKATGQVPFFYRPNGTFIRQDLREVSLAADLAQRLGGKAPQHVEEFMAKHGILSFLPKG